MIIDIENRAGIKF
jgi:ATP-dependent RNA helicase DDX21